MFFIGAGFAKIFESSSHISILLGWAAHVPYFVVMAVGFLEIFLGFCISLNLVFSGHLKRLPIVCAYIGGVMTAVMATVHLLRVEAGMLLINIVLFILCCAVAWGYRRLGNRAERGRPVYSRVGQDKG